MKENLFAPGESGLCLRRLIGIVIIVLGCALLVACFPLIGLEPIQNLSFSATAGGGNPAAQTVSIVNSGWGMLTGLIANIQYDKGSGWLNVSLNTTAAPATLTVQPMTGSLSADTYTASINISSGTAGNSPQNVTVAFTITSSTGYVLTTAVSPTGSGSVILNPPGGSYASGTQVTLTANAASGYSFSSWSGDTSGTSNPITVTMNGNKSITANFVAQGNYALTVGVSPTGSGSVILNPPGGSYPSGTQITLTANAASGTSFSSWSGDTSGTSNPITVTMNGNKSITANFVAQGNYALTVGVSPTGSGSVILNPPGGSYPSGTQITLTANPASGFSFSSWSGDASGTSNPITVTMNGNKSITANFVAQGNYALTVAISPTGSGSVTLNPAGGSYPSGTQVTLTANPASGYSFSSWSGNASGTSNPITVTMNGNKSITANFAAYYTLTVAASPMGSGSVKLSPSGGSYPSGTQVTLTANPASGYSFSSWSGNTSGTSNPITVTMNGNKSITANFAAYYTLTVAASPTGSGSVTLSPSGGRYLSGTQVTLTANPASGYSFSSWSGNASGASNPITVTMNGNKSITANFAQLFTLRVTAVGGGIVTSSPGGISCPANSSRTASFTQGTQVTLTATPSSSHSFYQWSGDLSGTSSQNMVTMNGNRNVTATFVGVWDTNTTQDTYVVDHTAMFGNYEGTTEMEVGTVVRVGISYHSRTFLDFHVCDNIPAGATVVEATLRIYVTSTSGLLPFDVIVGCPLSSWTASTVTWITQPLIAYNSNMHYSIGTGTGYRYWDVAEQVQSMINAHLNYGLALAAYNDLDCSIERRFDMASLHYSTALAAHLTVKYLP